MANKISAENKSLYSLIPLDDFKALLGIDDREDRISRFCLLTATIEIEQYCKRRLRRKTHTDYHTYTGDHIFTLREYPVKKIISVNKEQVAGNREEITGNREQVIGKRGKGKMIEELVEPELYQVIPECGSGEDWPHTLALSPAMKHIRRLDVIKVAYTAGYSSGKTPADLASACLELAAWNLNRYRGRRIGLTGNVRGSGREGEHFELSMPENVRVLLEPYKRRVI